MKLSPPQPYNNDSYAELQIFDALRNVRMPDGIGFNSLHLVSHQQKRMSEIDFVLVCSMGVFVFEVKGGRVFQKHGKWYSRSKQKDHLIDNPFNQSRSALFSLLDSLKLKGLITANVPTGYGVLVPNTVSLQESVEYDVAMFGEKSCLKGFGSWLEEFINYWVSKIKSPKLLNFSKISEIANFLRPGSLIEETEELFKLENLNLKQQQIINAFKLEKKIICEGAAGTGKTHLIGLLAKNFVNKHEKLLILCESKWLKGYLKSELGACNIVVATIESLLVESRRAFITHYDVVIVDEAQDIYQSHKIDILKHYFKGGLDEGRWVFFQDLINKGDFFNTPDENIVNRIKLTSQVQLTLDIAYRYSRVTLNYLSDLIGSEKINTKKISGPKVEEFWSLNEQDELNKIESAISTVLAGGYTYSDITLLSDQAFHKSIISKLPSCILSNVIQLDDFNIQNFPLVRASFSQLHNFKGLENQVVILLDFNNECLNNTSKAYVALTRASKRLLIVWQPEEGVKRRKVHDRLGHDISDCVESCCNNTNWKETLNLTFLTEECELFIEHKMPPPICGYELIVDYMVAAEVELAWPSCKICIFGDEEEAEVIEIFNSANWRCYQTPLNNVEQDEIRKIVMLSTQT